MEQRANIEFCFKMRKTATETFQLFKQACDNNALSHIPFLIMVFERFRDLKTEEDIQGDEKACVHEDIEMQTQTQISVKFIEGLLERWRTN
jgi:hypothetical protein